MVHCGQKKRIHRASAFAAGWAARENSESGENPERYRRCIRGGRAQGRKSVTGKPGRWPGALSYKPGDLPDCCTGTACSRPRVIGCTYKMRFCIMRPFACFQAKGFFIYPFGHTVCHMLRMARSVRLRATMYTLSGIPYVICFAWARSVTPKAYRVGCARQCIFFNAGG